MDGGKWKTKKDPVLISEYKLMDRKEQKLRSALEKDSKLVDKQRQKLGIAVEALANIEDGYYKRYIKKEPARPNKEAVFFNKQSLANGSQKKQRPAITRQTNTLPVKSIGTPHSQLGHEYMSIQTASSKRRQVTYQNCESYPNTANYIKRILDPKEYLHLASNRSNDHADDFLTANKSQDRRRVSVDDDSAPQSEAGVHKPLQGYSKRIGSAGWKGKTSHASLQKGSERNIRPSSRTEEVDSEPQFLDLVEYLAEKEFKNEPEEQLDEIDQENPIERRIQDKKRPSSKAKDSQRSPQAPLHDASFSQDSKERPSVARSSQIHPKQVSYENAMKLREGKIFAKFDRELKIYDLRDLDCKIGVDVHLLHRK